MNAEQQEVRRTVTVRNWQGLHLRVALQLVDLAKKFRARIIVRKDDETADGEDAMKLVRPGWSGGGLRPTARTTRRRAGPAIRADR